MNCPNRHAINGKRFYTIADILRHKIVQRLVPGQQLPTEMQLAARFQVSVPTIRAALQTLVDEDWIYRRHGSGTYVRDPVETRHVGIVMELDISHPQTSRFHVRVAHHLREWLRAQGLKTRLYTGNVQPGQTSLTFTCAEFLEDLAAYRLCGVAYVHPPWSEIWWHQRPQPWLPSVGMWLPFFNYRVQLDYGKMVREGVRFLVTQGRRRLALIGWAASRQTPLNQATRDYFQTALAEHGLTPCENWIRLDLRAELPGAGWEQWHDLWRSDAEKPDGLLILDEMLYEDVRTALQELNVAIPDDLLLVTHASRGSVCVRDPAVARLEFDPDACAEHLGQLLVAQLRRQPITEPVRQLDVTCYTPHRQPGHASAGTAAGLKSAAQAGAANGFEKICRNGPSR